MRIRPRTFLLLLSPLVLPVVAAYVQWTAANPTKDCPEPGALWQYTTDPRGVDPWGHPYVITCDPHAPPERRLRIRSRGPDGAWSDDLER